MSTKGGFIERITGGSKTSFLQSKRGTQINPNENVQVMQCFDQNETKYLHFQLPQDIGNNSNDKQ